MKWLYAQNDQFTCISDEDWDVMQDRLVWADRKGYVRLSIRSPKPVPLARFLMLPQAHEEVDHWNGYPLDNRRSNLRVATRSQNMMNAKRSKRGVHFHKREKKWMAKCQDQWLGYFATEIEAHEAYRRAQLDRGADFSFFNRPVELMPVPTEEEKTAAVEHRACVRAQIERDRLDKSKTALKALVAKRRSQL